MSNNRIEILLNAVLSEDSTKNVQKQVKELQKRLDSITIDSSLLKGLKELGNIKIDSSSFNNLNKELEKARGEVDKLKTELNNTKMTTSPLENVFKLDKNTIINDLNSFRAEIERRGGAMQIEFDTSGTRAEITKLSATFDKFGQKVTEVFEKAEKDGKHVWDVSKIKTHDSAVRDSTREYEKLENKLKELRANSKLSGEEFERFNRSLDSVKHSKEGMDTLSKAMDNVVKRGQNFNTITQQLEKLESTGKITNQMFEKQSEILAKTKNLENPQVYQQLRHELNLLTEEERKHIQAVKQAEIEAHNLNNAHKATAARLQELKAAGTVTTQEYNKLSESLKRVQGNQTGIEQLNSSMERVAKQGANFQSLTLQLEKLLASGKITTEMFNEQYKALSKTKNLDNAQVYKQMQHNLQLLSMEQKQYVDNMKRLETEAHSLNNAYDKLSKKLLSLKNSSQITTREFEEFNKVLNSSKGSQTGLDALSKSMDDVASRGKHFRQLSHELNELHKAGKLSTAIFEEQQRVLSNTRGLEHANVYKNIKQEIQSLVAEQSRLTQEEKKAQAEAEKLATTYSKLYDKLAELKRGSQLSSEEFARFSRSLDSTRGSAEGMEALSKSMESVARKNAHIKQLTHDLNELHKAGRISTEVFNQQKRAIDNATNLDNVEVYKTLKRELQSLTAEQKRNSDAVKEAEQEAKKLEAAQSRLVDIQTKLIRTTQRQPKIKGFEEYNSAVEKLNSLNLNQATMSSKELDGALRQVNQQIDRMSAKATEAGRTQVGIIDSFKIALEKFPVWVATSTVFYGSIRSAKEFMNIIVDIDTKMTDLRKVMSDNTDFDKVFERATVSAEKFGRTISETMDSYIEFAKQGFKGEELGGLADAATVAANVADLTSKDAAGYLTGTLVQWKKESTEAMDIIDKWNQISNDYATTTENLAQGQMRAAATARSYGMDMEQLNAVVGTVTAMTKQSGNEVGNFVKSVLPNLTSSKTAGWLEKLNIDLVDAQGNMRDVMDVYTDVAKKMTTLSSVDQTKLMEDMAGKYQLSRFTALLQDLRDEESMYYRMMETQANATGSAINENEEYLKSYQARINAAKREIEQLALALGEAFLNDTMTAAIAGFSTALQSIANTITNFGALAPAFAILGVAFMGMSEKARTFGQSVLFGTESMSRARLETANLSEGMSRAEVATNGLNGAFKSLAAATVVGLGLGALGFAFEKLLSYMGSAKAKTEEFRTSLDEITRTYQGNKDAVEELTTKYARLEEKLKGDLGEKERNETLKELKTTQTELAKIMPDIVIHEDEYGNKLYKTSEQLEVQNELIKERIALEERRLEIDEQRERTKFSEDAGDTEKELAKELQKIQDQVAKFWRDQNLGSGLFKLFPEGAKGGFLEGTEKENIEDLSKAIDALRERIKELHQENKDGQNDDLIQKYSNNLDKLISYYSEIQVTQSEMQILSAQLAENEAKSMEKRLEGTFELDDAMKQLVNSISMVVGQQALGVDETKELMRAVESALSSDEVAQQMVTKFAEANKKVVELKKEAQELGDEFDSSKLDAAYAEQIQSAQAFRARIDAILSEMRIEGLDTAEFNASLDEMLERMYGFDDEVSKATTGTSELTEELTAIGQATQEFKTEIEELIEGLEGTEKALYEITGTTEELLDLGFELMNEADELVTILEFLGEGTAEYEAVLQELEITEAKLLELYPAIRYEKEALNLTTEETLERLSNEQERVDLISAAYEDLKKGQIDAEQKRALANYKAADANIKNIEKEIEAVEALLATYEQRLEYNRQTFGMETTIEEVNKHNAMLQEYRSKKDTVTGLKNKLVESRKNLSNVDLTSLYEGGTYKERQEARKPQWQKDQEREAERKQKEAEREAERKRKEAEREAERKRKEAQREVERARKAARREEELGMKARDKAAKDRAKELEKNTSATYGGAEAEEYAMFVADEYARAIQKVNMELTYQSKIKQLFPQHSAEYRKALESELKLEKDKLFMMQQQAGIYEGRYKKGQIVKTGVVTEKRQAAAPKTTVSTKTSAKALSGWQQDYSTKGGVVDMKQYSGATLEANVAGTVAKVLKSKNMGNTIVVVDAKGRQHSYSNVNAAGVVAGNKVKVGDYLGEFSDYRGNPSLKYSVTQGGQKLDASAFTKQAKQVQTLTEVTKKQEAATKSVTNASKIAADHAAAMYDLEGDILNLREDIFEQQMRIKELEIETMRAELAVFDKRRNEYEYQMQLEEVKYDTLDQAGERYIEVIKREMMFMGYKQQVNQEEIAHLDQLIKSGQYEGLVLEELIQKYRELKISVAELNLELAEMQKLQIDSSLLKWTRDMEYFEFELAKVEQTMRASIEGSNAWMLANTNKLVFLRGQQHTIRYEIEELQKLMRKSELLTPNMVEEYHKRLQALTLQYRELGITIRDTEKQAKEARKNAWSEVADKVVQAYKDAISEKRDMHLKSIDEEMKKEDERHKAIMDNYRDELDAFREIVNEKIAEIDRIDRDDAYSDEMNEMGMDRQEIIKQMNLLELDDSREAKYKRKRLKEDLDKIDKDIESKRRKRESELRKEELKNLLNDKEEEIKGKEELENKRHEDEKQRIDDLREYWNKHYEDRLNDERKFAQMREDIINQNFNNIEKEFKDLIDELTATMPELENTMNGTMDAVGTAIRQNVIDNLNEAMRSMREFNAEFNAPSSAGGGGGGVDLSAGLTSVDDIADQKDGTWRTKYSRQDLDVIAGKFIRDKMPNLVDNPYQKQNIKDHGSNLANAGRAKGSKIDNVIRYDAILKNMGAADLMGLSEAMMDYAPNFSTPELRDYLEKHAKRLKVSAQSYDTGGFTGSWGKEGKLANLHQNELVLTEKETNKFGDLVSQFNQMSTVMKAVERMATPNTATNSGDTYEITLNIDRLTGTHDEAEYIGDILLDKIRREKGIR